MKHRYRPLTGARLLPKVHCESMSTISSRSAHFLTSSKGVCIDAPWYQILNNGRSSYLESRSSGGCRLDGIETPSLVHGHGWHGVMQDCGGRTWDVVKGHGLGPVEQ